MTVPTPLPSRPRSSIHDAALIALFVAILAAPLVNVFRGGVDEEIRLREHREPAPAPDLWLGEDAAAPPQKGSPVLQFPRQFEKWFNDRRGFRRPLLRLYESARLAGWTVDILAPAAAGSAGADAVIIGQGGWLYFAGENTVPDYRATRPFSVAELDRWREVLTRRRDWLAGRGIGYVVVFTPNKHTVYPEHLPPQLNRVGEQSRLDQLVAHMDGAGVTVLDLRQPLKAAKAERRTYHRTDTHWNDFGAYVAYREIMRAVGETLPEKLPGEPAWPLDRFEIRTTRQHGTDLARLIGSPPGYVEEAIRLVPRRPRRARGGPVTIPRTEGQRRHETTCATADRPNIVVLHDSFMLALSPLLSEHFRRVCYQWTTEFPADVIEAEQPALVIQQIVERKLMDHRPQNPAALR